MGFGARIGDTLRVPGRGLRRGIAVLVVLALAGATGGAVSLTAPMLVENLGLTQPEPPPVPPEPVPVLGPLPDSAPAAAPAGVAAVLDPLAAAMPGTLTGVVLDPADGFVLWERSPGDPLVSGSTAKILTAAAALLTLDPAGAFVTRAVAGAEPGTVVLVGGGDPTLTALPDGELGTYPNPSRLVELADEVRAAAPGPISRVVVDTSRYSGPTLTESWAPDDVVAGFITPIEPLMLDGGRIDPAEQDGTRTEEPAVDTGRALAELLDIDPDTVVSEQAPAEAESLGAVSSAPFTELVEHVIRSSDNVLGETLAREVAIVRGGPPTFDGATDEVLAALVQAGFDPGATVLADGSGLSRDDVVPAALLGAVLAAAAAPAIDDRDIQFLRPIVTGLPVAGGDGTLDDRYAPDDDAAPGRGVVRAKTGTLSGVNSLAGVVTDVDGRLLVFAFMSNGASPAEVRPRLDEMAAGLAGCGC